MESESRSKPTPELDLETLAERVLELLTTEPLLSRLVAALQAQMPSAPQPTELARVSGDHQGPVPIGPYEISPQFASMTWDGNPPTAPEWPQAEAPSGDGPMQPARHENPVGPRVTRLSMPPAHEDGE